MTTLRLSLKGNTWHCETIGDEAARQEVIDLFGTADLPTPYTAAECVAQVKADLQALNPDAKIQT